MIRRIHSKSKIDMFKEVVAYIIRFIGASFLVRNTYARNKCCVLVYHNPSSDVFNKHLDFLSREYNIINLDILVEAIHSKDWSNIPSKSIVITFDDGYKDNFALLGVIKKYKIHPTIYLVSQLVNTNRPFWFMIPGIQVKPLKKITNRDRLQYLNQNFGFAPTKEYSQEKRQSLNIDEIKSMQDFVDFQTHSCSHPVLTTCSDEECRKEIFQSKDGLETLLGSNCKHFSYPNGDYTKREIELLKQAGFLSARTLDVGWNCINTDPYKLKAIEILDNDSLNMLIARLSGIPGYLSHVRTGSYKGKHSTRLPKER